MSTEENKEAIRRFFNDVVNQGNLTLIEQIIAPEHVDTVRRLILLIHTAFPDFHVTLEDQIAEGEKVAAMFTASGTHQGETTFLSEGPLPAFVSPELPFKRQETWSGRSPDTSTSNPDEHIVTLPASWQQLSYTGTRVFHVVNGKIISYWGGWTSESERFTEWLWALHR